MVKFHDSLKIADVPFPFPYMQTLELLLLLHWIVTPILMGSWTSSPAWTGVLCFMLILIFWSLNSIAIELENPFGEDDNDLPAKETQHTLNQQLLLLIRPSTLVTPQLSQHAAFNEQEDSTGNLLRLGSNNCLDHEGVKGLTVNEESKAGKQVYKRRISYGALQKSMSRQLDQAAREEELERRPSDFTGALIEEMKQAGERAAAEVWAPMAAVLKTLNRGMTLNTLDTDDMARVQQESKYDPDEEGDPNGTDNTPEPRTSQRSEAPIYLSERDRQNADAARYLRDAIDHERMRMLGLQRAGSALSGFAPPPRPIPRRAQSLDVGFIFDDVNRSRDGTFSPATSCTARNSHRAALKQQTSRIGFDGTPSTNGDDRRDLEHGEAIKQLKTAASPACRPGVGIGASGCHARQAS